MKATGAGAPDGPWVQAIRLGFGFVFALVLVSALAWLGSDIRQVQPDSRAVVLRLGRVVRVQQAGLLLAWPRPLERIVSLPGAARQLPFAFDPLRPAGSPDAASPDETGPVEDPRDNAGFFLTADGVVRMTVTLFYRIDEPQDYVLQEAHLPAALRRLTMASLVSLAAARDTDTLVVSRAGTDLTEADQGRRERLRSDLVLAIDRRLADLAAQGAGLGIEVSRADLSAALPAGAKAAFDGVLVATQLADQNVADARSTAERTGQRAEQDRSALIAGSNAAAEERRSTASSRTAAIRALAVAVDAPSRSALLYRIYHERMRALLHRAHAVDAIDPRTGARLLLPGQVP